MLQGAKNQESIVSKKLNRDELVAIGKIFPTANKVMKDKDDRFGGMEKRKRNGFHFKTKSTATLTVEILEMVAFYILPIVYSLFMVIYSYVYVTVNQ